MALDSFPPHGNEPTRAARKIREDVAVLTARRPDLKPPPAPPWRLQSFSRRRWLEVSVPKSGMNRVSLSVVFALAFLGQGRAEPFRFSPRTERDRPTDLRTLTGIVRNVERDLSQDLLDLLMQLQELMLNGDPENGIPVLDPFLWEHFEIAYATEEIELAFSIDGLDLRGLSNFEVTNVEFDILSLRVDVAADWPKLDVKADRYFLDGTVFGLLPLFGEGYIDMSILEFAVVGGASLVALPDSVSVGELSFAMTFGELEGVIDGLLGGGDLGDVLNEILNLLGADLFDAVLQMVADDIAVLVQGFLNQMLEGMTLQDIINMLTGGERMGQGREGVVRRRLATAAVKDRHR
ncbi:unnamed protein product [Darwinula stevensoni]|uniref:Uncharacterized protein n=1 Tax=Darwinula stevensoni TaxID=69355 RepID=A0A7R9A450_9CRUS|nr:unnamed protein product [Darwinula stevensoni]CAG0892937.1 unnamed protein product [Darwinula stevensoni]